MGCTGSILPGTAGILAGTAEAARDRGILPDRRTKLLIWKAIILGTIDIDDALTKIQRKLANSGKFP
jgi:hypothetical protein